MMNNNKICLSCYILFHTQNIRQVLQLLSRTKVLKGHQLDSVTHHSNSITALKTIVMIKSNFITNFIHKVYNKHPSGGYLVYSYRLFYRPTAWADHPHGSAAQPSQRGRRHRRLAGRDRRRRPPISCNGPSDNSLDDLSDPGWLRGVDVPQRFISSITVDDKSSRPTRRSSVSCGPTSLGYPLSSRDKSTRG